MKGFFFPKTGSVLDRSYILLLQFSVTVLLSWAGVYWISIWFILWKALPFFNTVKLFSWHETRLPREHAVQGPSYQASSGIVAGGSSSHTLSTRCHHHFRNMGNILVGKTRPEVQQMSGWMSQYYTLPWTSKCISYICRESALRHCSYLYWIETSYLYWN